MAITVLEASGRRYPRFRQKIRKFVAGPAFASGFGMRFLSFVFAAAFVLWVPRAFAAVMVLPVESTNIDPVQSDAIGQMVGSAYQIEKNERVVPPAQVRAALAAGGSYEEIAQRLQATEYLYVTAIRLDARIVITASRYAADGTLIYSAKITASGLDDVEPASDRLAKALIHKRPPTETRGLDNVTSTEGLQPKRVSTARVAGFKGGFVYPIGWKARIQPMMSVGFDLRLEGEHHFLEIGVGFAVPAGAESRFSYGGLWSELGASYYLMHEATSPYIGVGILPRLMSKDVTNLAAYGQGGVMFFRDASTRLYTDLRIAQNLLPVGFSSCTPVTCGTRRLYPTEISLNIGIGF
jgi:hypothetical protein